MTITLESNTINSEYSSFTDISGFTDAANQFYTRHKVEEKNAGVSTFEINDFGIGTVFIASDKPDSGATTGALTVNSKSNTFKNHHVLQYGGALYLEADTVTLSDEDSTFEGNLAFYGGAIACINCVSVSFTRTIFT